MLCCMHQDMEVRSEWRELIDSSAVVSCAPSSEGTELEESPRMSEDSPNSLSGSSPSSVPSPLPGIAPEGAIDAARASGYTIEEPDEQLVGTARFSRPLCCALVMLKIAVVAATLLLLLLWMVLRSHDSLHAVTDRQLCSVAHAHAASLGELFDCAARVHTSLSLHQSAIAEPADLQTPFDGSFANYVLQSFEAALRAGLFKPLSVYAVLPSGALYAAQRSSFNASAIPAMNASNTTVAQVTMYEPASQACWRRTPASLGWQPSAAILRSPCAQLGATPPWWYSAALNLSAAAVHQGVLSDGYTGLAFMWPAAGRTHVVEVSASSLSKLLVQLHVGSSRESYAQLADGSLLGASGLYSWSMLHSSAAVSAADVGGFMGEVQGLLPRGAALWDALASDSSAAAASLSPASCAGDSAVYMHSDDSFVAQSPGIVAMRLPSPHTSLRAVLVVALPHDEYGAHVPAALAVLSVVVLLYLGAAALVLWCRAQHDFCDGAVEARDSLPSP